MDRMLAIASAVVRDAVRRKVVWVVVLFAALLSFVAPSLPSYGLGVVSAIYREVAISLMFAAALVVVLSLSALRIPAEVERRTVFSVLGRDVRRWQYVVGTWLGIFLVTGIAILAFTVVSIAVGGVVYREFMWRLAQASLAVWLEMGAVSALTIMLSTVLGPVTSIVGAIAFIFAGHSVSTLVTGGAEGGSAPAWVPSLELFNVINPVAHGAGYSAVYALSMLGVFACWVAVFLFGGSWLFERRDL